MNPCDLSILIVTYNSARLVDDLLGGLADQIRGLNAEVVLVDNASHDGTADAVSDRHPWVKLVRSTQNLGFAAGNNLAASHARGRVLLLLNPDALPEAGCVAQGLSLMDHHPTVGLAGARLLAKDGSTQPSGRMFPSLAQEAIVLSGLAARFPRSRLFGRLDRTWADPAQAAPVDWVPGAFALIRRPLFDLLGGFDERYFLYYEEVDLCRRIRASGMVVQYWPALRVRHIGGVSARTVAGATVARAGSQLTLWRARSGLLYYRKNHGWWAAWAVNRLERGWHALRGARAALLGQVHKAAESATHRGLLARAWNDTLGGRVAPPRPW
jgi:N-acetylglucosaminyl-diphospho-decaprenol L-rhamnosyltransferase